MNRWTIFCDQQVTPEDLDRVITDGVASLPTTSPGRAAEPGHGSIRPLAEVVAEVEWASIGAALAAQEGNISWTAKALAIDPNTLKRKMSVYGLR